MRHGPARIGLERQRLRHPAAAEIADRRRNRLGGVGEAVKETVHALEHRARPEEAGAASSAARMPDCAAQPACRRLVQVPSARYSMMPLAIEAAGDAERVDHLLGVEPSAAPTPAAAPMAPNTAVG
jgi:hypothetical protein